MVCAICRFVGDTDVDVKKVEFLKFMGRLYSSDAKLPNTTNAYWSAITNYFVTCCRPVVRVYMLHKVRPGFLVGMCVFVY